jgi:hypothetical protein
VTITPTTSTVNGASTLVIPQNTGCTVTSDGTNYQVSACSAISPSSGVSLSVANTWTAAQTFTNSDIKLLGSSTGATTFTSANAGASNFTVTVPAATDTLVTLAATQTLTNKSIAASEVNSGTLAAAQMPALTGDVTSTSGTVATSVVKVNGAAVPTSAGMVSTNSSGQIQAQAVVTATAATGPTNDYSPAGFGTTTAVLYLTPTAGGSTINGLVAQSTLQQVYVVNAEAAGGADNIFLVNQAAGSTAANRFLTSATVSLAIPPGGRVLCVYLPSTVSRWNCQ